MFNVSKIFVGNFDCGSSNHLQRPTPKPRNMLRNFSTNLNDVDNTGKKCVKLFSAYARVLACLLHLGFKEASVY